LAQQRGNTGGFGGGGGNGARGNTGSSASTSGRTYPNNGTIGDAYFSIDPETRRVVYIADEATARYIAQVLTNLDRPKPQVLIKVVFVQVTHNNASDIGIEGGWGRQDLGGSIKNASAVNGFGLSALSSVVGTNFNQFGPADLQFRPGVANHATGCRAVSDPRDRLPGHLARHCPGGQSQGPLAPIDFGAQQSACDHHRWPVCPFDQQRVVQRPEWNAH
jgi:hypothetical protein